MMTFSPLQMQALQAPHAQQLAQAACKQAQEQWTQTRTLLSSLGNYSPATLS